MAFGDVNTQPGLNQLEKFLGDHSYVNGYWPGQSDASVFETLGKAPNGDYPHVQRWFRHIASFELSERQKWAGGPISLAAGAQPTMACPVSNASPAAVAAKSTVAAKPTADDDDDVDLFGSDEEEDAEAARIREERLAAYAAKKSKKPALIAKSSVLLDVKPWDDETDMKEMEKAVRTIEMDGLLWGASKLVPVGYGIHKLQIMCVIEDDKVSIDLLTEKIEEFQDFVQSVDIAAFNKI